MILSTYEDFFSSAQDVEFHLISFDAIAAFGHVFLQHSRRKAKPQKVLLRIKFKYQLQNSSKVRYVKAKRIYWGSGSRYISIDEIEQILWGKYTPNFLCKDNKELDDNLCFSIIGKQRNINLSSINEYVTEFWVKGLSDLTSLTINPEIFTQHAHILCAEDSDTSYSSWDDDTHVTFHFRKKKHKQGKK